MYIVAGRLEARLPTILFHFLNCTLGVKVRSISCNIGPAERAISRNMDRSRMSGMLASCMTTVTCRVK